MVLPPLGECIPNDTHVAELLPSLAEQVHTSTGVDMICSRILFIQYVLRLGSFLNIKTIIRVFSSSFLTFLLRTLFSLKVLNSLAINSFTSRFSRI